MSQNPTLTFPEFPYERPDLDKQEANFRAVLEALKNADTINDAIAAVEQIDAIRSGVATAYNIGYIRHSIDTKDEFYKGEKEWFDQHMPATEAWRMDYYRALLDSAHREALQVHFGDQIFNTAELSLKTFQPEIIEDLQRENKTYSEYMQLKGGAAIDLDGETYNLSSIAPLEQVADREKRKAASSAKWGWYTENQEKIEGVYDRLVELRDGMAKKLGYDNYVGLGYARMNRTDYGPKEVAVFREEVKKTHRTHRAGTLPPATGPYWS